MPAQGQQTKPQQINQAHTQAAASWVWSLAMAQAGKAALQANGLRYLRWLPIPTWLAVGLLAVLLFLLHAPFALPFVFAGTLCFIAAGCAVVVWGLARARTLEARL